MGILEKIFGNYSTNEIKRIMSIVNKIDSFENDMMKLSDADLRNKTSEFRQRLSNGENLNDILPQAYAVVREASSRVLNMRHFKVQLIGGIILHQGRISEMRTGEGKTLVSTLPAYLNALPQKGVHVVTVNDYLAKRDSEWMGKLHQFLGLEVGVVLHDMSNDERRQNYNCDITYATNNELGFDYLRDNMVVYQDQMVQRELNYAIIDEVDSVLIDEARTPLIISGSGSKSTEMYKVANSFVQTLKKGRILNEKEALNPITRTDIQEDGDFVVDEKAKSATLTQEGIKKAENFFSLENLSDPNNTLILHHINNALKANNIMFRDKDYVVQDEEIVIVDEFTGRLMPGRRYSDGLHQAIEAKENVKVNRESKTLATITFQNYFNKYKKKCGMTGTAQTEEAEFREIYGMDVVVIPTNKPVLRKDSSDVVYKSIKAKYKAVVNDIKECAQKGQPVLVGTVSIEKSEYLSDLLTKEKIPHKVLNAKFHELEADIISEAGLKNSITIATNMAGRGTDIKLGDGVIDLGGLRIIGTERHESRRIDNQLRGRAGRQGDPGQSKFYISLEDDLMRLFGSEKVIKIIETFGIDEDEPIEHNFLTKSIENAQKKVEGNNFGIRKHLLEYDQIMNEQREIIYTERKKVLSGEDLKDNIFSMIMFIISSAVTAYSKGSDFPEEWDMEGLQEYLISVFHENALDLSKIDVSATSKQSIIESIYNDMTKIYGQKEEIITSERMREIERVITLRIIDQKWMNHIDDMDQMRQGITLRAYAQKDPLLEYKFISYDMFDELSNNIKLDTVKTLFALKIVDENSNTQIKREPISVEVATNKDDTSVKAPKKRVDAKLGRNDLCSCGSQKKYKHCCGK